MARVGGARGVKIDRKWVDPDGTPCDLLLRDIAGAAAPALGGLAKLLDADGDGQVMDDLAKAGGSLLGGLFGKRKA